MRWIVLTGFVLVIATVLGLASSSTSGQAGDLPLQDRTVCIDPGHGGGESGAVYQKRGRKGWTLVEKEVNLDVALNLRTELVAAGATVAITREDDSTVSLERRVEVCNGSGADITVSLHTNGTRSSRWDGSMTLMNKSADGPLAAAIHPIMYNGLKEDWDGRFRDYGINVDEWYIPKNTNMPAVILEPVFLSNPDEAKALKPTIAEAPGGRRSQIARVEYDGILAYFASQ
ncbi:MAG: N-acetylmuramoyl-L-alanine amidase [Candidatus Neomarinimicrobiota bacterium]